VGGRLGAKRQPDFVSAMRRQQQLTYGLERKLTLDKKGCIGRGCIIREGMLSPSKLFWSQLGTLKDQMVTMSKADYKRKADQAYEMAALAAQDGDAPDYARQLAKAKEYDRLAQESE